MVRIRRRVGAVRRPAGWWILCMALVFGSTALAGNTRSDASLGEASEVAPLCRRIGSKLASIDFDECMARQLRPSGGRSVLASPILVKEYGPLSETPTRGRVLLIGGIHGDEYSSVTVVFKWLDFLDRFHSGLFHWRVTPLMNPDGLLRERSQRMNHRGVDLNRNFPCSNWQTSTRDYWTLRTSMDPRRYPGPSALSEPESRWLVEEIQAFEPDVIIAVHAPYSVVDFDGPPKAPQSLGSLQLRLLGTYPGSLGRYAGEMMQIPVVTVELPHAGIMPSREEQYGIFRDLLRWLRKRLPAGKESLPPSSVASVGSAQAPPS